jgi:hypothetical protein
MPRSTTGLPWAAPTAEDLRNACCADTAEIGRLLLAFKCPLVDANGAYRPTLVLSACEHCPDLIYPLLECGAEMPDAVPLTISTDVFREAYWKQVRVLYLLFHRSCFQIHKDVLSRIATYLAEPIRVERVDSFMDVVSLAPPPLRFRDLLNPLPVC